MTRPINPHIIYQGIERQPVIVIDDFVADPDMLIEDAAMLAYQPMGEHYPGVRAVVHPALVSGFMEGLDRLLEEVFGLAMPLDRIDCWYSLVTAAPETLRPNQRLPHFDSTDPGRIALLHYLSRSETGGTAFFRHRTTGYESLSDDRLPSYSAHIETDIARHGLPPAGYISGDTPLFEQIAHFDAVFNRAILYRGNTLHCADIPAGMALSAEPVSGRLTVNSFLQGRLKE